MKTELLACVLIMSTVLGVGHAHWLIVGKYADGPKHYDSHGGEILDNVITEELASTPAIVNAAR